MKNRGVWLALLGISVMLVGCTRYEKADIPEEHIETTVETMPIIIQETEPETQDDPEQQRVEADGKIPSYLTGEMTDVAKANRRPIAIMMSNDKQSLPHYGINHAGVIYEAPVEGGMNRFMSIIEDYDDLKRIGSVRSCRTYYTYFAREFDAIYVHFGQSVFALPYLEKMEHLNGIDGKGAVAFYRSKDRKSPHNAYASAAGIEKGIAALGYSKEYPKEYNGHYRFARPDCPVLLEDGVDASYVSPGYVYNQPWFEYNKDEGLYYRFQYGGPHNGDEGQLKVKNIIFQYCPTGFYKPSEYLDINVHSPGVGYYFTNGRCTNVTWEKSGEYGVTKYYDKNGQEILLNPGKTWVCIIPFDRVDKAEFHGEKTD
ncbi:MAG: DUF3048 domain-containing protein [Clostridium sp.]